MRSVCDRGGAGRSAETGRARGAERATDYDLRRRQDFAATAEAVLARADLLTEEDAALVRSVFGRGMTLTELARAAGRRPHTVSSRLRRITARMRTPTFVFVAHYRDAWAPPMRAVATACILEGRPVREAAAHLKMSVAAVRRHRDAVLALAAASLPRPPRSPTTGPAPAPTPGRAAHPTRGGEAA